MCSVARLESAHRDRLNVSEGAERYVSLPVAYRIHVVASRVGKHGDCGCFLQCRSAVGVTRRRSICVEEVHCTPVNKVFILMFFRTSRLGRLRDKYLR